MPALESPLTVDNVVGGLRTIVALSGNEPEAALRRLSVPATEMGEAKVALEKLLRGDAALLRELQIELSSQDGTPVAFGPGGKTQFKVLRKWKIPYGFRLYVAHKIVAAAADMGALVTAVSAACGPEAAPVAAGAAVAVAALKLLDRGNGIMITQIPPIAGPCIPTPQF